ncbi:uncharacterised protein [Saccharolobus solfataricus]|uniref:Uncharacterized protein n=2 Tax=Saccharolobus solfataricus TaxID=2287 RepID=A0A157T3S0_SACSO|nr:uncharacterised protein [Saccharolobus solfataricus]
MEEEIREAYYTLYKRVEVYRNGEVRLNEKVVKLSIEENLTYYDAVYLYLSRKLWYNTSK